MKKIFFLLCFQLVLLAAGYAQVVPKGMNYQAVARNLKGEIILNQKLSLKIYLFSQEGNQRTNHYSEIHEVATNELGLFNLIIGEGTKYHGEYGLIPWNKENIWMEVAIKDKGQTEFTMVSSSRLLAVPYAIHAGSANKLNDKVISSFSPPEPGVISTDWSVFGNAKTDAAGNPDHVNALGTTDHIDLIMITNNEERLRILPGGDIVTKLNFEVGKNFTVGQNLYVILSSTIGDSLIVKKNVLLNTMGGSTINYGPFTVANLSSTLLTGKLTVDKATDLNSTLNVDGTTDMNGRLFVNRMSPTILTGTLQVDSTTNLNDALNVNNMSPTYLSGTLRVEDSASFMDKVKIVSLYSTDTSGILPSGSLQVGGGAFIKKNLYVGGVAKFGGPVAFAGPVSITDGTESTSPSTGALKVSGGVGIGLNLNVGGAAMIGGMTTIKDITESVDSTTGALKVLGGVGIRQRLNVGGAVSFGSTLLVSGVTTLNNTLQVTLNGSYIAHFINTTDRNGISIQINNTTPSTANNFVEFRKNGGVVIGRIEGENASEYTNNAAYILELSQRNNAITIAEIGVAVSTIYLAGAIAGIVASATSTTLCAGLGVCVSAPIISMIVWSAADAVAKAIVLATSVVNLIKNQERRQDFINYKAARIGVTYESGSGDYAEWLPKADPAEVFLPGQIVGLKNGKITKKVGGTGKLFVISTKPIVLGNMPEKANKGAYEKVAFMGQVPVHVLGKVNAGDYILPSGNDDGLGIAISPANMQAEDYTRLVGVAWSASENDSYNLINTAIGLNDGDLSKVVIEQKQKLVELKAKLNESNAILANLLPEYRKSALKDEGGSLSISSVIPAGTGIGPDPDLLASFEGTSGIFELSRDQVLHMMDAAEKIIFEKGVLIESLSVWNQLKSDPVYKERFIKDIQNIFKKETQKQIELLNPQKR